MHRSEWSLISFTLLTQLGVGLIIMMTVLLFWNPQMVLTLPIGITFRNPGFLVLCFVLIATIISFLHLGSPLNAPNALNNLSGSWISREIMVLSVFGLSVLFVFLSCWLFSAHRWITSMSLIVSSIIGVFLIYSMVKIYLLPTVPSWNLNYTPVSFFISTVILGMAGILIFILIKHPISLHYDMVKLVSFLLLSLVILLIIEAVFSGFHYLKLSEMSNTGIEKPEFGQGMFLRLIIVRTILSFLASALFLFVLLKYGSPGFNSDLIIFLGILGVLFLASEQIVGRFLFYASYFRLGV